MRFRAITGRGQGGHSGPTLMLDLVFIALGLALFGVTAAYASACDRL